GFYFGRRLGSWALVLLLIAYVGASFLLPPHHPGPRPLLPVVAFNAALFAFAGGIMVLTLGSFRERMDQFRLICKRFELGDSNAQFEPEKDRLPDDLTLVARSFNEMRARLVELIGTDPLTGVLNRRAFEARLHREWRYAKRRDSTLALLMLDIDNFKPVNDTHGHASGDQALLELAEIMKVTARDTDTVGRHGGDEFVVLLPDTGWQGAMAFAERLRKNVDDHTFMVNGIVLEITISIGVALAHGTDPISVDDLQEQADRSLYRAKSGGRNRISA
ncbi:MAG TPA: GGDEF domain-containing protein, partial [Gemmatimonadaceae bacterium]|nr:GGDEF domain-containing protein [Gemmatimonadaceae bacterium]